MSQNPAAAARNRNIHNKKLLITALFAILCFLFVTALAFGRYQIRFTEVLGILTARFFSIQPTWSDQTANILMTIRLPRICGAILAGMSLALSGAAYQSVFKNPLVSPDLLGVSAGACVGASLGILLHLGSFTIQMMALLCGLLSVAITCAVPRVLHNRSNLMLVLSGIIVSGIMSAVQGFIKYTADAEEELPSIVYWAMGSLASVRAHDIIIIIPPVIIAMAVLLILRWKINLLTLDEQEAQSLGVNVSRIRGITIVCSTMLTACAVCISGTIGWIGLVVPHVGRLLAGHDNRFLMPVSALCGGIFLLIMDTMARNMTKSEIPLSILTGMFGGPLFVIILARQGLKQN
jgi:iron complex transport system permease protein